MSTEQEVSWWRAALGFMAVLLLLAAVVAYVCLLVVVVPAFLGLIVLVPFCMACFRGLRWWLR